MVIPLDEDTGDVAIGSDTFTRFFHEHYDRLGRALYLVTGDAAESEDVAQEAMVRVYERWDRVSALDSPVGYLYRTALNLHRSRLRRTAVRLKRRPIPQPPDPLDAANDRDEIGHLLAALPGGQREALILVEWLGMSAEEAGHVLDIEPVSVRARISRAKTALRAGSESRHA